MAKSVVGLFLNSAALFKVALDAKELSATGANQRDAVLTAILFAAAAGEAFINEIGELAASFRLESSSAEVDSMSALLDEAEQSNVSTVLKYHLAKLALTGEAFDKGSNPFQSFALLMDVRNSLMHMKIERLDAQDGNLVLKHPKVLGKLPQHMLAADDGASVSGWITKIGTPAIAEWACKATAAIVQDIIGSLPSDLRKSIEVRYSQFY